MITISAQLEYDLNLRTQFAQVFVGKFDLVEKITGWIIFCQEFKVLNECLVLCQGRVVRLLYFLFSLVIQFFRVVLQTQLVIIFAVANLFKFLQKRVVVRRHVGKENIYY